MNRPAKFILISITALITALWAVSSPGASSRRTLVRVEDFAVISGDLLQGLIGADVSSVRLFSCNGSGCREVPVQVDKMDATGRYVFPSDHDKKRDGVLLDLNDEISFMVSDAGDSKPEEFKPEGSSRGIELEITDPLDHGAAWLYLYEVSPSASPDLPDYVSYRTVGANTYIESPNFALGYQSDMINYNHIRMRTSSGELGKDVLDRQRVGMVGELAGKASLPLNAPESLVKAQDLAVIDGPIRVIIDQVVMIHLVNMSFRWGTEYYIKYYRCGQKNSVYWSFPAAANQMFKTVMFYWSLDFTPDIIGSSYLDENHPTPVTIKGQAMEGLPGDKLHGWYGLYGPEGAVLQALDLDDDMVSYFGCSTRWIQDPEAKDRKGDFPGVIEVGFNCGEIGEIPEKQEYHWFNYILFPSEPGARGINSLKNIFEHPVEVKASPTE